MATLLDETVKAELLEAARGIELRSSAEVVIAVRRHSGNYLQAELLAGGIAGWATLAFMLFSPWTFSIWSIFLDPAIVALAVTLLARRLPAVQRGLTREADRRAAVRIAAHALFVEKGVSQTRGRTGLLVYVSQLEDAVELVADSGVLTAVDAAAWAERRVALDRAASVDGRAVARELVTLGALLATALPRRADDVNELPDEVSAT